MSFTNRQAWLIVALALTCLVALSGCSTLDQYDALKQCDPLKWRGWSGQDYCARKARERLSERGHVTTMSMQPTREPVWQHVPGASVPRHAPSASRELWWPATVQPL